MIGRTLGRYRITEEIGHGGMGVVYRAVDTRLGREVALKVLGPGPREDPDLQRRLRQEAQAAAALAHPAICVIHEIDEADGATFIAMELVRGVPLTTLVKARLLPARALDLALEVGEGLAEAHARGIVHRDLKPSNVMVTELGHAKVIDFGLAKLVRPLDTVTSDTDTPARGYTDPGRIMGTAAYMSPEQVRGGAIDPRSDLFSFGALLFEMLCGVPAFRRETGVETLHAVLKEAAPRLSEAGLAPVAGEVQRVLDKCLAKDPRERYASAALLVVDLRAVRRRLEEGANSAIARGPATSVSSAIVPAPAPAGPLRVLIVDDEDPARAILREYLSKGRGLRSWASAGTASRP